VLTAGEAIRRMEALPVADLATILGGRTPLVLAPHADDESLGCGGLLAECAERGIPARVLVLTDGTGSHPNSRLYPPERLRDLREAETRRAVAILGLDPARVSFLGLRDTAVPMQGPAFDAAVEAILRSFPPDPILLAPWQHDPHGDHEAAHFMAVAATARSGAPHLAYPVWGWTLPEETPLGGALPSGWRLDITRHLPRKRDAIAAHASQYSDLIQDDPGGFRLPEGLLARFERPFETFLAVG